MRAKLLYGASILVAVLIGYWLGISRDNLNKDPKYVTADDISDDEIETKVDSINALDQLALISHKEARALDKNFKSYKDYKMHTDERIFFENPLTINNAKTDFTTIFEQPKFMELRAYPGVKYDSVSKAIHFTLIFIGIDSSNNVIYRDTRHGNLQGRFLPPPIQDNNTPCNPCRGLYE